MRRSGEYDLERSLEWSRRRGRRSLERERERREGITWTCRDASVTASSMLSFVVPDASSAQQLLNAQHQHHDTASLELLHKSMFLVVGIVFLPFKLAYLWLRLSLKSHDYDTITDDLLSLSRKTSAQEAISINEVSMSTSS
jgi:hypothetical protein